MEQDPNEPPPSRYGTPSSPGRERRAYRRLRLAVDVGLRGANMLLTGRTENISIGGVFVATAAAPEVGEVVELTLTSDCPGAPTIQLPGRVAWLRLDENDEVSGCGIEFLERSPQVQRLLELFAAATNRPLLMD